MLIKAAIAEQVGRVKEEVRKLSDMKPDPFDLVELAADEDYQGVSRRIQECKCRQCEHRRGKQ